MKRILLLIALLTIGLLANAQDKYGYYKMPELYGDWLKHLGGDGEWLANSKKWLNYWGIQFAAGSKVRATVNSTGSWYFAAPSSEYSANKFNAINERLQLWSDVAIGTDKGIAAKSFFMTDVSNNNTVYGVLELGRNADPTLRGLLEKWFRIGSKGGVYFWGNDNATSDDNPTMSIIGNGVGIGTGGERPEYKLEIRNGGLRITKNDLQVLINTNSAGTAGWMGTKSNHPLCLGANNGEAIFIDGSQRIYIGLNISTINNIKTDLKNKYDLFVDKGVLAEDYAIAPKSTWSDFVFSKEYTLPSLSYVENFVIENKHLPDVPSAIQVAEEGYSQHAMNKALLQKIEELTLYIIEQQKQINELKLQQGQFK